MHDAQLLWPSVRLLLLSALKQMVQYGLEREAMAMAKALAGGYQLYAVMEQHRS